MIKVLNFSHPITEKQELEIAQEVRDTIEVVDIKVQINFEESLQEQAYRLLDPFVYTLVNERFIIRPPAFDAATLSVMAVIHGIAGHFPRIVTFKREEGEFVVWGVVDLQTLREEARTARI
jgi:hypothetical protein